MSTQRDPQQLLEQQVHEVLRTLPLRPAPEALTARVLEQLARRASVPWWRRQVTQWPSPARLLFALVAAGLMLLSLAGSARLPQLASSVAPALSWSHHVAALSSTFAGLLVTLLRALPAGWLMTGAVLATCAYLFLFGFGAAAYRLLYLER